MSDFKYVTQGPRYSGPDDKDIIKLIEKFGTRDSCSFEEIIFQYGTIDKHKTVKQLDRMLKEGKIEAFIKDWMVFVRKL